MKFPVRETRADLIELRRAAADRPFTLTESSLLLVIYALVFALVCVTCRWLFS